MKAINNIVKYKNFNIAINDYIIQTDIISAKNFVKFLNINISGEEPKKLDINLKDLQGWGGKDGMEKLLNKKFNSPPSN